MTAPLFLVPPGSLDGAGVGAVVPVEGDEAHHAAVVRRIAAGEQVIVGDGQGAGVAGTVQTVTRDLVTILVEERRDEPEPTPRLVLVQALAKGGRDEDAVEAATELGVDEVIPWQAARSIVQWRGPKATKAHQKWVNVVEAAAKQSRRLRTPLVADLVTTRQLVARLGGPTVTPFVLHEEASEPLAGAALPGSGEIVLVVGPEGGIGPDELDQLVEAGARPVRLGAGVLRSGTAGPAAISVVSAAARWR